MVNKGLILTLLAFVFVSSFLIVTALTEFINRQNGYYEEGLQESAELGG